MLQSARFNARLLSFQDRLTAWIDLHLFESVPRAEDAYSTHIPVLVGLGRLLPFRRIIEFGGGMFSTPAFLDRSIFPFVETVDTFETDREWGARVRQLAGEDARFRLHLVDGEMANAVDAVRVQQGTLIFVDDSETAAARSATIRRVGSLGMRDSVVVIHDFEIREYRRAASSFIHHYRFRTVNPNVGVLWNDRPLKRQSLRRLSEVIRCGRERAPSSDRTAWRSMIHTVTEDEG